MKLKLSLMIVLINLWTGTRGFAETSGDVSQVEPNQICDELKKMSRSSINRLYIEASSERPPEGEFASCELARPNGPLNPLVRWIADFSWNGMRYSPEGNHVEVYLTKITKRTGEPILKATGTYGLGTSFFDDNKSWVNEYRTVTYLPDGFARTLRDESREIRPGIYLGMTYARFPLIKGSEYVGTIAIINKKLLR